MSMRRATKFLGKLSDKPRSRGALQSTSPLWSGHRALSHDSEQDTSKLINATSPCRSVASERLSRSQETVKAWLDSSPTSVLDDQNYDESAPSSFESPSSSPVGSPRYRSYSTSRYFSSSSEIGQPSPVRMRAISPPRCPANKDPTDVSRIDAGGSGGGSFLKLAFTNAQRRGSSGAFRDDYLQNIASEECGSPGSEFSLTHEWHHMLEAGIAASKSIRESSANNYENENPYDSVVNGFELGLGSSSSNSMSRAHAQVTRRPSLTRSMELPQMSRLLDCSGSGQLKDEKIHYMAQHITTLPRHSAPLIHREQRQDVTYGDIRRNSDRSTSMHDTFLIVQNQKVYSNAASELESRYNREEEEIKAWEEQIRAKATAAMKHAELKLELKRARLIEKMRNDMAAARRKAEEKRAIAEAKRVEKAAKTAMESKSMRRVSRVPRGCLFLG